MICLKEINFTASKQTVCLCTEINTVDPVLEKLHLEKKG